MPVRSKKPLSAQTSALSRLIRMGRSPLRKIPIECSSCAASTSCLSSRYWIHAAGMHCTECAFHHPVVCAGDGSAISPHEDHGALPVSFFSAVNTE